MKNFTLSTSILGEKSFNKLVSALGLMLLLTVSTLSFGQNAIVGAGFSTGWGVDNCTTSGGTNFKYLNLITGSSGTGTYGVSTVANGTGNQYMRFGKDWSSTYAQYAITPGSDVSISPNTTYSLNTSCTNSGSQFINVGSTSYNYFFKTLNAGTAPTGTFVFFEVQGAVQSVSSLAQSPLAASVVPSSSVTVTATLSGSLSAGQAVYLRYSNNSFGASTVVQMTGSGTSYSATIPSSMNGQNKTVSYYAFTSGTANVASDGSNADLYTINLNNNSGLNYSYTIANSPVIVNATTGTVGPTGYATFLAATAAINAGTHTGAVTVSIVGATTEATTNIPINASGSGSASYTSITVKPAGGAQTLTAATAAGAAFITFNGADNVTFDGLNTNGNSLTISNTTASATSGTCTFSYIGDATSNTVTNCTVLGSASPAAFGTNGGVFIFGANAVTVGNDNNTVSNCNIGPAGANLPLKAFHFGGTTTTTALNNSGITINNNNIYNYFAAAVQSAGIYVTSGTTDINITNNRFYQTASRTQTTGALHSAIYISNTSGNNYAISGNVIGRAAYTSAASASSSSTTVTVGTTDGLAIGMLVNVSAGTGTFAANTYVTAINSATTFTVSAAPTVALSGATVAGNSTTSISNYPAGSYTFVGVSGSVLNPIYLYVGTTTATSLQGNTIAGIAMSGAQLGISSSAPLSCIYVAGGLTTIGDVTGNTIGSMSSTGSITYTSSGSTASDVNGMFNYGSSAWTTNNNNIGGITVSNSGTALATNFYGLNCNTGSGVTWTCTGNTIGGTVANSISNTSTGTGAMSNAIFSQVAASTITSNTVRNMTIAGGTGTGASASMIGISITATTANHTVQQNTVFGLANSNSGGSAVQVAGIRFNATTGTNLIARNLVYNLGVATSGASSVNGIAAIAGTATYQNNMVRLGYDASGTVITGGHAFNGINAAGGTNNFYHNSVYIGGTGVSGSTATNAFICSTTNTRSIRDNIFYNGRSNTAGTGKHYAISESSTTGLTINFNDYLADGTGGVLGVFAAADKASLSAWATSTTQDGSSVSSDPKFLAPTTATPDLHIDPAVATIIEQNGTALITDDYDGQTRSGLTPTDIGADAGNFTAVSNSPVITSFAGSPGGTNSGYVGSTITITGTGFTGVTSIKVGSVAGVGGTTITGATIGSTSITFIATAGLSGTIWVQNPSGSTTSSGSYTDLGYITTTGATTWQTPASWLNGSVPPSASTTNITINNNISGTTGTITVGKLTVNGTFTLTNTSGATIDINGVSANSGTITNSGTVSITGVTYTNSGTFTVAGAATLQLNASGVYGGTAPAYAGATSILTYNNGGTVSAGLEWTANTATAGSGVPGVVNIQNSTALNFGATSTYRQANGLLTIASGSGLTLSSASGGDLRIAGGLTNSNAAANTGLNTNGRALQTMGTGTYTKNGATGGTDSLDFLIIGSATTFTVATATNLTLTNTNSSGCLQFNAAGTLAMAGTNTVTLSTGTTVAGTSAGTISGNTPSTSILSFAGTCTWSPGGVITVSGGVGIQINGGLTNTTATRLNAINVQINQGGFVSTNPVVYGSSSTLTYNLSSGSYGIGPNEWPTSSSPTNVTVTALGGVIEFGGTQNQGARTVSGTLTLNGSVNLNGSGTPSLTAFNTIANSTATVLGTGAYTQTASGSFTTANTAGINGTLTTSGSITLPATTSFTFNNATTSQVTGTLLPATINNLTINNPTASTGTTISNNTVVISGITTLTAGALVLPTGVSNLVTFTGDIISTAGTLSGSSTSNITTSAGTSTSIGFATGGQALNNWSVTSGVGSSSTIGLNTPLSISGTLTLNGGTDFNSTSTGALTILSGGTLDELSNAWYNGAGAITISSGATFKINDSGGLTSSGATGAVETTGTRTFSGGANYIFNNSSTQAIGTALDGAGGTGKTGAITGNVTVTQSTAFSLAAGINLTINTPGTFTLGVASTSSATLIASATSVINGTGNVTFAGNGATSGSTLQTAHANGVNGTIQVSGTKSLTNGANNNTNFTFNGSVAQTTGALLPATVNNLNFSNTFSGSVASPSVTLSSSVTTTGTITFAGGAAPLGLVGIGAGNTLTVNGILTNTNANKLVGTSTSNFSIGGTGTISGTSTFAASGGGTLNNFTLNRSGATFFGGTSLVIGGTFALTNGLLNQSAGLTLNGPISLGTSGQLRHTGGGLTVSGSGAITGTLTTSATPLTLTSLTMDRIGQTLTLGSGTDVSISGGTTPLTLSGGVFDLASSNLTLTSTNTITVTPTNGGMIKATGTGQFFKTLTTGASTFNFPIGDGTNYTPVSLVFTANTVAGTVGARVTASAHPQLNLTGNPQADYINRYWSFTTTGLTNYTYSSTFTYVAGDIVGTQTNMKLNRYNGSLWSEDATSSAASLVLTSTTGLTQTTGLLNGNDYTGRKEPTPVTYVWNGGTSNDWATAANWTPSGVPSLIDNVTIGVPGSFTNCTINSGSKTVASVTLNGTGAFAMVSGTSLTVSGSITYGGSATTNLNSASTINMTSSISQTVPAINFGNLNLTGGDRVLASSGTIGISGTYTPGAGVFTNTGSTISFNGSGTQTIPTFTYNNLTSASTGARTLVNGGTITVGGTFTPGSNTYTNTGNTFVFSATSGTVSITLPIVASGNSFNILTINGTGGTFAMPYSASTQNLATTLNIQAGTFILNPSASTLSNIISVGTINISGGTMDDQAAITGLSTTLQVTTAWNQTAGVVKNTSAAGTDKIQFTGGGATTFTGLTAAASFQYYTVQVSNNTTLTLLSNLTINGLNGAAVFLVDGVAGPIAASTCDAGTFVISDVVTFVSGNGFTVNGIFKTANTVGLSGNSTTAFNTVTNTPALTLGAASTVEYTSTGTATITGRSDYANVTVSGAGTFSFGASTTLSGKYTQSAGTVKLTTTSTAYNLAVGGDFALSNASIFQLLTVSTATASTTVTVTGNTTSSGTASIVLESLSNTNASGIGIFQTTDFTTTSTSASIVDIGTGTYTNNEFRIKGNLDKSGTGTFNVASSSNFAGGIVFNKTGTQTFSYAGTASSYGSYYISSGSTLQMTTGVAFSTNSNPYSNFTVLSGGTIDMGATSVISGGSATVNAGNTGFTLASGSTIKTANATGVAGSITDLTKNFSSGANYEFQGAATGTFTTTPTALTVNNLTINKTTGDVQLNQSFSVAGDLTMTSGNLDLNGSNNITLSATSTLQSETSAKLIKNSGSPTATNGYIGTTRVLGTNPGNVANLGMNISVASAMGSTTIKRFPKIVTSIPTSLNSIARIYSIQPTTASTTSTIILNYFDGELNSNTETAPSLSAYSSTGTNETTAASYAYVGATATDATANTITNPANISTTNTFWTATNSDRYFTVQNGDWNTGSTWSSGSVPPVGALVTINHVVTVNSAVTNAVSSVTISSGKSLTFNDPSGTGTLTTTNLTNSSGSLVMTNGGTLTIASGGTFANGTSTFTSGTGTLNFAAAGTITGTVTVDAGAKITVSGTLTNSGTLTVNGTFQINGGGFATGSNLVYGSAGTLSFQSGGVYGVTSGSTAYWPASSGPVNVTVGGITGGSGINFGNTSAGLARTVTGVFQTSGAVSITQNSGTSVLTLNGTCQINTGGTFSNAPTYGSSSTLIYNTGTTTGRSTEWSATTIGPGYPNNVQIGNGANTTLDFTNSGTNNTYGKAGGKLTVSAGSTFSIPALTAQNGSTGIGAEFVGDIVNDGAITLSGSTTKRLKGANFTNGSTNTTATTTLASNIGADIELTGNYLDNATFTANQRAVFFTGTGTQTISGSASAPFNIDYIVVTKASGIVQLGVNLLTGAPNGGNGLTLSSATDIFDLNGKTFILGTAGQTCTVSGSGVIRSSSATPGTMTINGTGAMGTLSFESANNTLASFTVDRTAGTGTPGVTLGSALNVTTTLALTSTTTLTLGGTLTVSASGSNSVAGIIAGTGALVKTGAGTLTLTAVSGNNTANTYSAGTTINGAGTGTISVTGLTNITTATITSASQSVTFSTTTPTNGTYQLLPGALTVGTQNFTHNADPTKGVTLTYSTSTVTVGPATITTSAISPTSYCAGGTVSVGFTTNANLSGTYTAQLSDASGSFASPVAIGTSTTTTISATIPSGTSTGSGYRIRVVNTGNSITGTDNGANITIQALPASAGSNGTLTICSTTTLTASLLFGALTGSPAAGGTWSPTPAGAGTYTYTQAATSPCSVDNTATVTVTIQSAPASAGSNGTLTICSTTTLTTSLLFGALAGSPAAGGTWSPTPAGAGTYTYTQAATSPCSSNNTATVTVTVQSAPASAGSNGTLTICSTTTLTTSLLFGALTGSPAAGGTWSPTPAGAGTYTYTQTATSPCSVDNTATVTVTVNAAPTASVISGSAAICAGSSTNLQVAITGGVSPYTVVYTGGTLSSYTSGSNISVSPTTTTTYTLTSVTDANGCAGTGNSGSAVVTIRTTISTNGGTTWSNGTPDATRAIVFDGSTGTIGANMLGCSLSLINSAVVTVASGFNVTLSGAITVASGSTFTLNNNANLLQGGTTNTNSGNIVVKRNSAALKRFDYTLWSSPVSGQELYAFSPLTFDNRFYVYNPSTNFYNAFSGFAISGLNGDSVNGTDGNHATFTTGTGYLIRTPWNHPTSPTIFTGTFTGVPNNGNITLSGLTSAKFYATGNPYPSTMSADQFITDNSIGNNAENPGDGLYFWRKTNNTAMSSYATYTTAGGVKSGGDTLNIVPSGIIQVGEGFIVKTTSTSLVFNNGQRVANNADQFLRTSTIERNRIWLNLSDAAANALINQMMVAYMTGATQDVDAAIDGRFFNDSTTALNSFLNNEEFAVQGRSLPFDASDIVPLAFKATAAGSYTITLDHVDGLFAGGAQTIYLKDNLTNSIYDLSTGGYTFTSDAGAFNTRFEIVYQSALGTTHPTFTANNVVIYSQNHDFVINTGSVIMSSVKVFDIRGRLLLEKKGINSNQTIFNGGEVNQVLMVEITSENGDVVNKKVIR